MPNFTRILMERQLSTSIKKFQMDNGNGFMLTKFHNLFTICLAMNGILLRQSYPHTSQQNGLAKRKHHHIMEMGLIFLVFFHLST